MRENNKVDNIVEKKTTFGQLGDEELVGEKV